MGEVGAVSGDVAALTIAEMVTGRSCAISASTTSRKTTIAASIAAAGAAAGAAAAVAGDYCGWCVGGDKFPARARRRGQLPHRRLGRGRRRLNRLGRTREQRGKDFFLEDAGPSTHF